MDDEQIRVVTDRTADALRVALDRVIEAIGPDCSGPYEGNMVAGPLMEAVTDLRSDGITIVEVTAIATMLAFRMVESMLDTLVMTKSGGVIVDPFDGDAALVGVSMRDGIVDLLAHHNITVEDFIAYTRGGLASEELGEFVAEHDPQIAVMFLMWSLGWLAEQATKWADDMTRRLLG